MGGFDWQVSLQISRYYAIGSTMIPAQDVRIRRAMEKEHLQRHLRRICRINCGCYAEMAMGTHTNTTRARAL